MGNIIGRNETENTEQNTEQNTEPMAVLYKKPNHNDIDVSEWKQIDTSTDETLNTRKYYGWIRDLPDHRDIYMDWPEYTSYVSVYKMIDLRETGNLPTIYDQSKLGSCTANAIAAAFEYDQNDQDLPKFSPSRLFIYYNERVIEGTVMFDAGASIRDGIKSINKVGICPEEDYPYDISKFKQTPTKKAYEDALEHRSLNYRCIDIDIGEVKKAISIHLPVIVGFSVYESFEKIGKDGIMPIPEEGEKLLGGHAVLIVGYDDDKEHLIVRNSWGDKWGDNGYFYMPYDFFSNINCADAWVITSVQD
jgi:C1A family cysteine protease